MSQEEGSRPILLGERDIRGVSRLEMIFKLEVSPDHPARMDLDAAGNITGIDAHGAAAKSGLQIGDSIVKVSGADHTWHLIGGVVAIKNVLTCDRHLMLNVTALRDPEAKPNSPLFAGTGSKVQRLDKGGPSPARPRCLSINEQSRYSPVSRRMTVMRSPRMPLRSSPTHAVAICL